METWVKFISDERVDVAPTNKGAVSNYNLSADLLAADGYKPLVVVEESSADKPRVKYRDADERVEQYAAALTDAEKNEKIRAEREARFVIEADPLKMDYDEAAARGNAEAEAIKAEWLAKKDEIREALPYVDVADTADAAEEIAESDADAPEEVPEESAEDGDD